jgi:acetyl-CoA C-acetyltransferase
MGNAAFVVSPKIRWGNRGDLTLVDPIFPIGGPASRAARATGPSGRLDDEAPQFNVTRAEMDQWAYTSQMRYEKARAAGLIDEEMIPIEADGESVLAVDEAAKPWATLEKMAEPSRMGVSLARVMAGPQRRGALGRAWRGSWVPR